MASSSGRFRRRTVPIRSMATLRADGVMDIWANELALETAYCEMTRA
jgi:hypothetical protein